MVSSTVSALLHDNGETGHSHNYGTECGPSSLDTTFHNWKLMKENKLAVWALKSQR